MGLERHVDVVHGDICTEGLLARALSDYEIDSVFHLAAQTIVGAAARSPASTFEANIRGTWTVLEACRLCAVKSVIVASSDKAYGASAELPYTEDLALSPRSPYEVSKATADLLARSYWHSWELPVAVTRLANVYGGGDVHSSRLVPEAVTAALSGRTPVIRSDGTPQRDFLYVEDAVAAYLCVGGAPHHESESRRRPSVQRGGAILTRSVTLWSSSAAWRMPTSSPRSAAMVALKVRSNVSGSTIRNFVP